MNLDLTVAQAHALIEAAEYRRSEFYAACSDEWDRCQTTRKAMHEDCAHQASSDRLLERVIKKLEELLNV